MTDQNTADSAKPAAAPSPLSERPASRAGAAEYLLILALLAIVSMTAIILLGSQVPGAVGDDGWTNSGPLVVSSWRTADGDYRAVSQHTASGGYCVRIERRDGTAWTPGPTACPAVPPAP